MGKHSMPKTHKRAFNKTMAIALAAGVSFGGVQIVGPEMGMSIAGEASAATLEKNALTDITLKSKKTGDDLFKQPEPKTTKESRDFVVNQGQKYTLGLDFKIPDSAQPGDSLYINFDQGLKVDGIGGNISAPTDAGRKVGHLDAGLRSVKFVVSDDVANAQKREAHFDVPVETGFLEYVPTTTDAAKAGEDYFNYVRLTDRNGDVVAEWKSTTQFVKVDEKIEYDVSSRENDNPLIWDWNDVNLNKGTSIYDDWVIDIGMPNVKYSRKFLDGSEEGVLKTKATLDPDAQQSSRDVTVRYHSDDPDSKIIYTGAENGKNTIKGRTYKFSSDPVKSETAAHGYNFYTHEGLKDYESTFKRIDDQTVELTIHDIPIDIAASFYHSDADNNFPFYGESPYEPGKTVKMTGTFVNGVGEPESAFSGWYNESRDGDITMPSFDGYGSAEDIHRTATMTATVNGKDANSKKEAVAISSGGTGHFKVNIKNTGNIGAGSAVIKFPEGVTDKDGKTEHVVEFPGGLAPGTNKDIDLGDLNVADGANENKFTVEMAGFKTMSDPAWTNATKSAESFDPNWDNAEVPDGGSVDVTPKNTKGIPDGTKYELTGDHPKWITINPKTGVITAKPPQGEKPAPHKVTVTTTYPDGSTDKDTPTITVTHSDIFINGKPDVKPDGTVTLHRNDGKDIIFKVPTGSKVEVNKDGDLVITQPGGKKDTVPLKHTKVEEKGKPGTPDHKIIITDENGKTHEFGTYDKFLESVKDDGKGNYTFTMNDGTKLGPIQLGDDIVGIADDGKGNLIVTHKDGSKDTVPLKHTTVKEEGKPGEDGYKITLTTPDGKKVTLDGYDNYVESIKKQDNGDYLVKRNDGTEWTIKLSDIRDDIKKLKGKDAEQDKRLDDLENRVDGIDEEIENLGDRITKNEGAIEDHRKSINDLNKEVGSINNELGDIKDELARLDGQDIKEVRDNGDGTYTLIRNNGDEVTGTIDTSGDIKSITDNGDGTITLTKNDGSTEVVDLTHTKVETKGKPGDKDHTVTITTPDGNKVTLNGSNTYPSNVRDNGDGTYTIVLNDGTEVEGKIGDGQDIKELVPNEDGTMTVIHKDGSESVVDLKQVEITEQNKGTPEHTVTITSPNGDTVTFNVFDKYVTNVVKNEDGNYDIFRSDVDGGNTVWKTIVLSDIRGKIADLETRADQLEEKDADLQRQIDELKGRLDNTEKEIESLKDRTDGLEKAVAKINARLSVIDMKLTSLGVRMDALEGRVDTIEETEHAWGQCFGGILATAIPLLAVAPLVAGSNIQIPGAAEWNNQIQRTLGIYNEQLSRMAGQYQGVAKAAATILGVAGGIGLMVHTAKACGPYSKTDAMQETKAGKLSSKLENRKDSSSEKKGLSSREK